MDYVLSFMWYWMPYICCFLYGITAMFSKPYRGSASILFLAFLINVAFMPIYSYLAKQLSADIFFVYGGIDALTAYGMLIWGTKYKYQQTAVLMSAILLNIIGFSDYETGYIPVLWFTYIIFVMNLAQLYFMWGGINGAFTRIYQNIRDVRANIDTAASRWPFVVSFGRSVSFLDRDEKKR